MHLYQYVTLFHTGQPVPKGTVKGLIGRILRGRSNSNDFATMTNDPNRPLVLLVNSESLEGLVSIAGSTYSMLKKVGYDDNDIAKHYREGLEFKLVIFEDNGSSLATLATWDNMIALAKKMYPQVGHMLDFHNKALKATSFDDIVRMSGKTKWDQVPHGHPDYMDVAALQLSGGGLAAVRRFLFDTLHLRRLYRGDGWTYDDAGKRGVEEYVVPNMPLSQVGNHELLNLPKLELPKFGVSTTSSSARELPIPAFFDPQNAMRWDYATNKGKLLDQAGAWRAKHKLHAAAADKVKVALLLIDAQKDFCLPAGTLYVGGQSGNGAIEDCARTAAFIYRNLHNISAIIPTLDTHQPYQIFTRSFWYGLDGNFVDPFTALPLPEIESGKFRVNPVVAGILNVSPAWLDNQVRHYADQLLKGGKYTLLAWPEHCVLGDDGHALTGVINEARLFHSYARGAQNKPEIKGAIELSENYSIMSPEVTTRWDGGQQGPNGPIPTSFAQKNTLFFEALMKYDVVVIAGQAASHCVKSSIDDILAMVLAKDASLAKKIRVLEDCMSAVVSPAYDFTPEAAAGLKRFEAAGMHLVKSTTPMEDWADIRLPS